MAAFHKSQWLGACIALVALLAAKPTQGQSETDLFETDRLAKVLKDRGVEVYLDDGFIGSVRFLRDEGAGDAELALIRDQGMVHGITVSKSSVTDAGLRHLAKFRFLSSFKADSTKLSDASIAPLIAANARLEILYLDRTEIGDATIEAAIKHPKLRALSLVETKISRDATAKLKGMPHLDWLLLSGTSVDDAALIGYSQLKKLSTLELDSTQVGDAGVQEVAHCPSLEYLTLRSTRVTDKGVAALAESNTLRSLELSSTAVTDKGLEKLKGLRSLKSLMVDDTPITEKALKEFERTRPDVRICGFRRATIRINGKETRLKPD